MGDGNWFYVGLAYGLTWVVIVGYYLRVAGVVRQAQRELTRAAAGGGEE